MPGLKLWFWIITSDTYPFKHRRTTWRMTEEEARKCHGDDAMKVEGSLFIPPALGAGTFDPHRNPRAHEPSEDGYPTRCMIESAKRYSLT